MNAIDIIDQLPSEFVARLKTNRFFDDIVVIPAEKGDIASEYAVAQAAIADASGKRGVAVIVLQVVADDYSNNLSFGPMVLRPAFQVIENVELNNDDSGTKKSARKVARKIRDVIKGCNLMGLVQDMRTAKPCIEPVQVKDAPSTVISYQVSFECLEVSTENLTQVQMPAIDPGTSRATPQVILACATPGAVIWYTTDDSYPVNGTADTFPGSTAQQYAGPITIPPDGFTVRACAYLDGDNVIASGINRAHIQYE